MNSGIEERSGILERSWAQFTVLGFTFRRSSVNRAELDNCVRLLGGMGKESKFRGGAENLHGLK